MALAATVLASNFDNVDRTTTPGYTSASISPAANSLLLICTHWAALTTAATTINITGLSLTWSLTVFDADGVRSQAIHQAQCGASPGSGTVSMNWTAGDATQAGCGWIIVQITGHNTTTPIVQSKIAGGDGTTATAPTATLTNAIGAAGNRVMNFVSHRVQEQVNPRTNWTELADVNTSSPSENLECQWRDDGTNETTFGATWTTSARYQMLAVEIAVASAAAGGRPKTWTGSAWVQKPGKIWTGSAWVEKPVKRWNGSAWITLT
jgi:hypothetical protein